MIKVIIRQLKGFISSLAIHLAANVYRTNDKALASQFPPFHTNDTLSLSYDLALRQSLCLYSSVITTRLWPKISISTPRCRI